MSAARSPLPLQRTSASRLLILSSGGPSGIRTQDRRIKSPLLYRTELKALLPLYGPVTAVFSFAQPGPDPSEPSAKLAMSMIVMVYSPRRVEYCG